MIGRIAVGHHREARKPDCIRAVCGELILTFLFVFTSVGSSMTAGKLEGGDGTVMGLTATALANSLVVAAMVSSGVHISGSHFNPAVTLGIAMGGYITLFRSFLYMMAQLLGSTLACLLLKFLAGSQEIPISRVAEEMTALQGVGMEITFTFLLLFSVYGIIIDPRKTVPDGLGPLFIGLLICTISLAGGSFSGASMNPARSFGPAFASGNWTHQWVYWVGPIIGSGLAGLIYENLFMVHKHVFITKKEEFY